MTDNLLDLICQRFAGHPSADLTWRELLRVRDAVDRMLTSEVDRRQLDLPGDGTATAARRPAAPPGVNVTAPRQLERGECGAKGEERTSLLSPLRSVLRRYVARFRRPPGGTGRPQRPRRPWARVPHRGPT